MKSEQLKLHNKHSGLHDYTMHSLFELLILRNQINPAGMISKAANLIVVVWSAEAKVITYIVKP